MSKVSLQDWYEDYLDAFNTQDLVRLERYLSPDVYFDWGGDMDDLDGRDAFFDFYRVAWKHITEQVRARILEADEHHIRAWVENTLVVTTDWPDSPLGPYTRGEVIHLAGEMTYKLDRRTITRIE